MKAWISKTEAIKMLHSTGRLTENGARSFIQTLPQEKCGARFKVHRVTVENERKRLTALPATRDAGIKPLSAKHREAARQALSRVEWPDIIGETK